MHRPWTASIYPTVLESSLGELTVTRDPCDIRRSGRCRRVFACEIVIEHIDGEMHVAITLVAARAAVVRLAHVVTQHASVLAAVTGFVCLVIEEDITAVAVGIEHQDGGDRLVGIALAGRKLECRARAVIAPRSYDWDPARVLDRRCLRCHAEHGVIGCESERHGRSDDKSKRIEMGRSEPLSAEINPLPIGVIELSGCDPFRYTLASQPGKETEVLDAGHVEKPGGRKYAKCHHPFHPGRHVYGVGDAHRCDAGRCVKTKTLVNSRRGIDS